MWLGLWLGLWLPGYEARLQELLNRRVAYGLTSFLYISYAEFQLSKFRPMATLLTMVLYPLYSFLIQVTLMGAC